MPLLYSELTDWYQLLDPVADHALEAGVYVQTLLQAVPGAKTLLELGSGAGNNAFHLKQRFDCTLTDLAPRMLELSRRQNPECEHLEGDMCTLRLDRVFDLVLVHDAVMSLTTRAQLEQAAATAFLHTRPGGAALFLPDGLEDTFQESSSLLEGDEGQRSLRAIEWSWDPQPGDELCRVDYVLVMREAGEVRTVHESLLEGLFSREKWIQVLSGAGFQVEAEDRLIEPGLSVPFFLCRRP